VIATKREFQAVTWNRNANDLFACKWLRAPATKKDEGLAAILPADPFALPRLHQELVDVGRIPTTLLHPGLASDGIGDLPARRESSPLARIIEDPATRLAHEGAFA